MRKDWLLVLALIALLASLPMAGTPKRRACLEGGVYLGQTRADFESFMRSRQAYFVAPGTCYFTESCEIDPVWNEPFGMKVFWSPWSQRISNAGGSFSRVGLVGGPSVPAHASVEEIVAVFGPPSRRSQDRLSYRDLLLELYLSQGRLEGGHLGDGSQGG